MNTVADGAPAPAARTPDAACAIEDGRAFTYAELRKEIAAKIAARP